MEVKQVMRYGKLTTPFLVNMVHSELHKVKTGEDVDKKGVKFDVYQTMVKRGTMDICSHPDNLIEVGDLIQGQIAVFEVLSIIESRPSNGSFPFFKYHLTWQRCEVKFADIAAKEPPKPKNW